MKGNRKEMREHESSCDFDQSAQRARDFLVCCLKHEPAVEAMKALHGVAVALKTYREDIQGRPRRVFSFFLTDVLLFESNYNVSAVFVRTAAWYRALPCPRPDYHTLASSGSQIQRHCAREQGPVAFAAVRRQLHSAQHHVLGATERLLLC